MNTDTGELFYDYDDGIKDALGRGLTQEQAEKQIMPLGRTQYDELSGMNRAQRRQWAKDEKRKNRRKH